MKRNRVLHDRQERSRYARTCRTGHRPSGFSARVCRSRGTADSGNRSGSGPLAWQHLRDLGTSEIWRPHAGKPVGNQELNLVQWPRDTTEQTTLDSRNGQGSFLVRCLRMLVESHDDGSDQAQAGAACVLGSAVRGDARGPPGVGPPRAAAAILLVLVVVAAFSPCLRQRVRQLGR